MLTHVPKPVRRAILFGSPLLLLPVFGLFLIFALVLFVVAGSPANGGASYGWGTEMSTIGAAEIPAQFIPIYKAAGEKYHVPWNLLAAHHRVETRFSTLRPMISPVGALGPMQFMPATWAGWKYASDDLGRVRSGVDFTDLAVISRGGGYGVDANGDGKADPMNDVDAIYSAANYLARNGAASGDLRGAVYAYNHDERYVQEVLSYANLYVSGGGVAPTGGVFAWPLPYTHMITTHFGELDEVHARPHNGIDIAAGGVLGQPVQAVADGEVKIADWYGGYGKCVVLDHGNGLETVYGHLAAVQARIGERVRRGQVIGQVGSTGYSTGPHLHFEVDRNGVAVDPMPYLKGRGQVEGRRIPNVFGDHRQGGSLE